MRIHFMNKHLCVDFSLLGCIPLTPALCVFQRGLLSDSATLDEKTSKILFPSLILAGLLIFSFDDGAGYSIMPDSSILLGLVCAMIIMNIKEWSRKDVLFILWSKPD